MLRWQAVTLSLTQESKHGAEPHTGTRSNQDRPDKGMVEYLLGKYKILVADSETLVADSYCRHYVCPCGAFFRAFPAS
jgi:hypothetical protein